ncbi:MAG: hypothetical protein KKB51_23250 [Candidatus Riflebacteria bacterium]|nr:hypothetical protein [Candidatus Riflebacteria bacterium]
MKTLLAVLICVFFIPFSVNAQAEVFPLATGSEWIYEAKVKWTSETVAPLQKLNAL